MADAAFDVFFDEFGVELQAEAQVHHALGHAASKTAGPHVGLGALFGVVFSFLCSCLSHYKILVFFAGKSRKKCHYIKAYLSKNITVSTTMTQWTFLILPVNAFTKV